MTRVKEKSKKRTVKNILNISSKKKILDYLMHKLPFFFFLNRKREREGLAEFSEAHMG